MYYTDRTPTCSKSCRKSRHYSPLLCEAVAHCVRIAVLGTGQTGCIQADRKFNILISLKRKMSSQESDITV